MIYDYRADPILGGTLAYWLRKRSGREMPRKRDIDPVDMPRKLLPHLQIVDVIDRGARFRFRLVGTALVEAYGREYTGKYPDEVFTRDRADYIENIFSRVTRAHRPFFVSRRYSTTKGFDLISHRVYLPLSDDGENVNFIFAAVTFERGICFSGTWGDGAMENPSADYIGEIDLIIPIKTSPRDREAA